tara:strand:+ start:12129 stop:12428 length:300 start_codon:yes stop_codon:yes gene_type:complete
MSEDVNLDSPEYLNWDSRDENVQKEQDRVVTAKKRRAVAYHDVFSKTEAGRNILTEWVQSFCTSKPASSNATDREVHMNDGKRELVSEILIQIQIGEKL